MPTDLPSSKTHGTPETKSSNTVKTLKVPKKHERVGRWILEKQLGRGGNGEVWLATDNAGRAAAVKLLMKLRPIPYARFQDEVTALKLIAGIEGILPILEADLPSTLGSARPWYAMPIATPLLAAVESMSASDRVEKIAEAAETLV